MPVLDIVGVAADSTDRPRITPRPFVYFRYTNQKTQMTFTIRTSGDPASLVPPLTRMISGLGTRTFEPPTTGVEYRDRTMIQERLFTSLLAAFGSLALLISSLGIYGLLIYLVARRTPEIGLRMALGAQRGDVLRMVIRESLVPVGIGIALGWISSFGLTRLVQNLLFEVSRGDPWAVAGTAAVLLFTAGMAAFLPARRAARIDPMRAFHYE